MIIIGMQIIGLYFTNNLEKELHDNFKKNITQYAKQLYIKVGYDQTKLKNSIQIYRMIYI
ncbi:cell wall metabolism sensor histidine kinase WalK, partial [Staphylococcus aureus]|uniref:cell wall metabolism sensor histidine kinase WalK n=1 Tax=Staphylococcus aureus TaxID=1280 RepID=UPI00210D400A